MGKLIQLARRPIGRLLRGIGLRPQLPSPESMQGMFVRHQVLPEIVAHPGDVSAAGYSDMRDLTLKVAHAFEASRDMRRRYYQPIADLVRPGDRVLDIGCGDGTFLELARERGANGIGLDLDPDRVAECQAKGFESHCIRVQEVGRLTSGGFDFVSMIHIIEHIAPAEALEILDCITRALSENGRIFIVTPNIAHRGVQTNFWLDITHVRPYPEALLGSIATTLGFPYFQSGDMAFSTETWCYAFRNPDHAIRPLTARKSAKITLR